jgi:Type II secretion system (T2SS), protein M subtype b
VDLVAVAVLLSPLVGSQRSRRQQLDSLWRELQLKTRQVEPLRGMDRKIAAAQAQIHQFYEDRLPAQDSGISEALGKVAAESGVQISNVKYQLKDELPVGLQPVMMEADFSGGYSQLVRFINAMERNKLFFIVDGVDLDSQQQGTVKLRLGFETYLRNGS